MDILAIIQARMSSQRLPGKVLTSLGSDSVLGLLLKRLQRCSSLSDIAVATSDDPTDDQLEAFCASHQVKVHRGSLSDVTDRFRMVLEELKPRAFVRISADSPFYDPKLLTSAIELFHQQKCQMLTNVSPRTFPKGLSIEILETDWFLEQEAKITDSDDREHVTSAFYKKIRPAKIHSLICSKGDLSKINLCVDTEYDLVQARRLVSECGISEETDWEDIVYHWCQLATHPETYK